ncbi:MAG: hypothetical protein CMP12_11310 [Zunongwangia sp.]|uniref:sensor histidine kinase n=1 Tax=Zunongwangia profunda TaxID=398743 RepID=UPI000C449F61|nr:HAMP domain-containing sensor histidine kinase [Zunongwangia profunda]MAO36473.1 hypothetical protein [Zunongwangia sp.]MBG44878.1 hypothetical protein [Aequorivita sp.]|tara:strand:+ start:6298 stop:7437 length:1140 start_codon:yes stop_codon:yes gene_type:complete
MKEAAEAIRSKKEDILKLWEETIRKEIPVTKETEPLILLNNLPNILDDLLVMLERAQDEIDLQKSPNFKEIVEDSMDHGRHRAGISHFSSHKIINEHMVLHRVLIIILKNKNAYNQEVGILLSFALETSMAHSVKSFSISLQEMREKLIATLAHDIRNPLSTALLGLSSFRYEDGEGHLLKLNQMATNSVRRAIDLVEDLLDAITVRSGEGISLLFSEYNVVEDVKLIASEAAEAYSNKIVLNLTKKEIHGVFASTAVRRILENLITNAVKYGAIDEPITISLQEEGKKVRLKVHNHGNSISPQDQKDIFNFLIQKEKNSPKNLKSWGIGLAFVKMAAEAHGGHVEIESEEGKGTTFSVILHKHFNTPGKKRTLLNTIG